MTGAERSAKYYWLHRVLKPKSVKAQLAEEAREERRIQALMSLAIRAGLGDSGARSILTAVGLSDLAEREAPSVPLMSLDEYRRETQAWRAERPLEPQASRPVSFSGRELPDDDPVNGIPIGSDGRPLHGRPVRVPAI